MALSVTPQEALNEAVHASQYLQGPRYDPFEALRIIEPIADCSEFKGAGEEQTRRVRSIISSVVADCHRELGDVNLAAKKYREASEHWIIGGYAPFYAEIVITHELAEHFERALECVKANRASWATRPLIVRLYFHIVSVWWIYPSQWQTMFRDRRHIARLEMLIEEKRNRH